MKTQSRHSSTPGSSHSHHHSHHHSSHSRTQSRHHGHAASPTSSKASKSTKSTTPLTSPHPPHSVGQNHPPSQHPKLSPGRPAIARVPSPNYFGLTVESTGDSRESSGLPREHWSPPSSSVRSFAAAIPTQMPLDANPEFEAFKRQADLNRGKSFSLNTSHHSRPAGNPEAAPARPRPSRWHTHASETRIASPFGVGSNSKDQSNNKMDVDHEVFHDSAYVSSDSKRNSESSLLPKQITSQPFFESPRPMDPSQPRSSLTRSEDRDPRLSVMEHKAAPPSPRLQDLARATTLPASLDASHPCMISCGELKDLVESLGEDNVLLLDIRSAQNFSQGRIDGALNLCIPTTLLKRATFNIQKLQQTFQQGSESEKFSNWREMDSIVVYDSHSSEKRDATTALNMIKKFTNEGYSGKTYILRGGFVAFQGNYPDLIETGLTVDTNCRPGGGQSNGGLAPVIGGVSLPGSDNGINPFFSNIRQNMDLADGVGQFDIACPSGLDTSTLPQWLREAASPADHGKKVSDKFLNIERSEQSRMRGAYSAFNSSQPNSGQSVQLCGVEKGGKNRYKDILPFEHARVRLKNKPAGGCDYVNASHLKSSRSNKRYIASQGPLPATYEDFWSVIWDQDVRVIVMLTAESEGGQLKCHPYWKGREHGPIRLKPLSEKKASLDVDKHRADSTATPSAYMGGISRRRANTLTSLESSTPTPQSLSGPDETPCVIIRKFALAHAAHPFAPIREITHLHFPAWPDFGTPAQPSHLLALVELANVMQRAALPVETASIVGSRKNSLESSPIGWFDEPETNSKARPMLVHCSAGCGRTGTFCTVDSVIDMLKRERQTKLSLAKSQDAEGDISMVDDDGDVSPTTTRKMSFQFTQSPPSTDEPSAKPFANDPNVDTKWLGDDSVDLIQETVEDFREQRLSMVQSLRQYVLCYETVLEWIQRLQERGNNSMVHRRSSSLQQRPHMSR